MTMGRRPSPDEPALSLVCVAQPRCTRDALSCRGLAAVAPLYLTMTRPRVCCRFMRAPRWRPQIVSCEARVAASWRATIKTRNAAGRPSSIFMGGPTLRDKRPKINNTSAIQRSSPLAQNGCAARATPRLAAHSHNMERLARARMKRQQALAYCGVSVRTGAESSVTGAVLKVFLSTLPCSSSCISSGTRFCARQLTPNRVDLLSCEKP